MTQRTFHLQKVISDEVGLVLYEYLKASVIWEEGVKSRKGFTRYAKAMSFEELSTNLIDEFPSVILNLIEVIDKYSVRQNCIGVYLNYYLNGTNWTPNHKHKNTTQIIISLGATRTLTIANKNFQSRNGDIFVFGSAIHGVPIEEVSDGRISIALFNI